MNTTCLVGLAGGEIRITLCLYPQQQVRRNIPRGLQTGKPKALYFGELLKYLYTSSGKSYGAYNGTLPEKYFYKPSIKLPFAPAWTLEGMVAAAKKQGITIQYATVYKTLVIQEQEFKTKNSKTPTNVSKTSNISEVKNGRTYAGVKWYPTTITSYNPLPGFNIFGTGLCIRIKNNNDKIINFIKTNGEDYGWSWCSNVPVTDPDFQNILVYSAGMSKPIKYKDRTIQEVDAFKPAPVNKPPAGAPGPGQKQVWMPGPKPVVNPETGKITYPTGYNPGNNGKWVIVPDALSATQVSNSSVYSGSPWQSGSYGVNLPSGFGPAANPKGLKVLVLNGGAAEGAGTKLAAVLKKLGFHCSRGFSITIKSYLKDDITFVDETYVPNNSSGGDPADLNTAETVGAVGAVGSSWVLIGAPPVVAAGSAAISGSAFVASGPAAPITAGVIMLGATAYFVAKNPIRNCKNCSWYI